MEYTALYREWRPKKFQDVVGQEHITTTLKNQIQNNRIAHAYLFCGTRGTGKTSTAKIMAKALNCLNIIDGEPCNECEMCKKINSGLAIDVTELDAASNNGVDKIRDIIEDAKYPPQEARYKVYVLDEVHMLSIGAVNAFLKTLEEPPSNVIFILATTDPQKLPITILSRCQRFDFKRIVSKNVCGLLRRIVDTKGILADEKSLELIARTSDGAMRDALSILDQAIAMGDGKIDYNDLVSMLGLVTNDSLFDITSAIISKNIEGSMRIIEEVVYSGKDMYLFIKDLIVHFRNLLMIKVTNNPEEVLDMSIENINRITEQGGRIRVEEIMRDIRILQEAEGNAKLSKDSRLYIELAIVKICKIEYDTSNEVILSRINRLEEGLKSGEIKAVAVSNEVSSIKENTSLNQDNKPIQNTIDKPIVINKVSENPDSKATIVDIQRNWKDILERFKARRAMIVYASILTGKPIECSKGIVTIHYTEEYAFSKERLEKAENNKIVNEVISEIMGEDIKTKFVVDKGNQLPKNTENLLSDSIDSEIFEVIDN